MKNLFAIIGFISIVIITIYYGIYTPFKYTQTLEADNRKLTKSLKASEEEIKLVYKQFDSALHSHLSEDQISEIYSDKRFFTKNDTEISVTSDNFQPLISYTRSY